MIKLQATSGLLKPSQRRQLLSWLKRSVAIGEQVGDFLLRITIRRIGRGYEMRADVHDAAGDFGLRARGQTWRDVCREIVRTLGVKLHAQRLALTGATV
ncbi:MAG: hypothetical protein ABIP55_11285 [Tepidisphaeraceae bacterium]